MSERARAVSIGAAILAAVIGIWWGLDALFVSEKERIEELVSLVTSEPIGPGTVDAALAWTDPAREPLEVTALGMARRWDAENADELGTWARDRLAPYQGVEFAALSQSITVEEDHATISLRLMSRERGMLQLELRLRKHGDDWLVSYARVGR